MRKQSSNSGYAWAIAALGEFFFKENSKGEPVAIVALANEEANFLYARRLARTNGWWDIVLATMQGLKLLYRHRGRRAEWKRLVDEIEHHFVDPATDGPLSRSEDGWRLVTAYRVQLARDRHDWAKAERLARLCVDYYCRSAEEVVARYSKPTDHSNSSAEAGTNGAERGQTSTDRLPVSRGYLKAVLPKLSEVDRRTILSLADSLETLGQIRRESRSLIVSPSIQRHLSLPSKSANVTKLPSVHLVWVLPIWP